MPWARGERARAKFAERGFVASRHKQSSLTRSRKVAPLLHDRLAHSNHSSEWAAHTNDARSVSASHMDLHRGERAATANGPQNDTNVVRETGTTDAHLAAISDGGTF